MIDVVVVLGDGARANLRASDSEVSRKSSAHRLSAKLLINSQQPMEKPPRSDVGEGASLLVNVLQTLELNQVAKKWYEPTLGHPSLPVATM